MPIVQPHPVVLLVMMALLASIVGAWVMVLLRFALQKPILPPSTPRVVPWGAGAVLASILVWFAMQIGAGIVYRLVAMPPRADKSIAAANSLAPAELMGLSAAGNVVAVLLIPILLMATSGARPRDFGLELPGAGRRIGQGVLAWPILAPCVFGLMLVAEAIWGKSDHPLQEAMTKDRSPQTVALLAFAGVIMAPISEELIFRGILLGWLTKLALGVRPGAKPIVAEPDWSGDLLPDPVSAEATFDADDGNPFRAPQAPVSDEIPAMPSRSSRFGGMLLANVAVSGVFALLHGPQWPAPVPLFVLAMGLGLLYQRTGSLIGPIALHMTFNGISTLLLFLGAGGSPPPADPRAKNPVPGPAVVRFEPAKVEFGRGRSLTRDESWL